MNLPLKNEIVPMEQIKELCMAKGLKELWQKIEEDPPELDFKSDGCSMWPDKWLKVNFYSACFFHDLKYWAGHKGEERERLKADAEFIIDLLECGASTKMCELMFKGVRIGGAELWNQSFSWGFGRRSSE